MASLKARCAQILSWCATCVFMAFAFSVSLLEILLDSTGITVRTTKKSLSYITFKCISVLYNVRSQAKQYSERAQWILNGTLAALQAWCYSIKTQTRGTYKLHEKFTNLLFRDIPKAPRHVAIIVNEECNVERMGSIVAWCIAIGVPKISLYDQQGFSVAHQEAIERHVRDMLQRTEPELKSNDSDEALDARDKLPYTCDPLLFTTPHPALSTGIDLRLSDTRLTALNKLDNSKFSSHKRASNKVKSGSNEALFGDMNPHFSKKLGPELGSKFPMLRSGYASTVYFLDAVSGGRATLVAAVRKLCGQCQAGVRSANGVKGDGVIDEKTVNDALSNDEEPDVALIFGPVLSLAGFLPWHTRLTEMICMRDLHSTTPFEFRRAMLRFSQCVHRYGK